MPEPDSTAFFTPSPEPVRWIYSKQDNGRSLAQFLGDVDIDGAITGLNLPVPIGVVTMRRVNPDAVDVSWLVTGSEGETISIAGSNTDGFAEGLSYSLTNNWAFTVQGGGITTANPNANVIACINSTRLTIGPADSQIINVNGCNITFAGQGIADGTALTVDSFSKGLCNLDVQVVCSHDGPAVEFRPSTSHTGDSDKNQGVSTFFVRVIEQAVKSGNAVALKFNAQNGESLNGSTYAFMEVNGGLTGVQFVTAGTGVITGCHFSIRGIHDYANGVGGIGIDTSGAAGLESCTFDIEISTPVSSSYTAKIASKTCEWNFLDLTAGTVKIDLAAAAVNNTIHITADNATALILTDASDGTNRVWFNGKLVKSMVVWDATGDTVVSGTRAGGFVVQGRTTGIRDLIDLKAVNRSNNGTIASAVVAVRVADVLTDVWEFDEALKLKPSVNAVSDIGSTALGVRALYLTDGLYVDGVRVMKEQGAAVADAAGGAVIDVEARAALNALLSRSRAQGFIAT